MKRIITKIEITPDGFGQQLILVDDKGGITKHDFEHGLDDNWITIENVGDINILDIDVFPSENITEDKISEHNYYAVIYPNDGDLQNFYHPKLIQQ